MSGAAAAPATLPPQVAPAQYVQVQAQPGQVQTGQPRYVVAGAPQVAGQNVTYSTPVTYAAPAPGVTYGSAYSTTSPMPMEPSTYAQASGQTVQAQGQVLAYQTAEGQNLSYVAPASYSTMGVQYAQAPQMVQGAAQHMAYPGLQPAPSMIAYPGATIQAPYAPSTVQQAWDNHFQAFGAQDVDKIMLDYDETSLVRLYIHNTGEKSEFRGLAQIRDMFAGLFAEMKDLSSLEAPVQDVDDADVKQVLLIWKCPSSGFKSVTDTFIFGPDCKIKRQNVVATKEAPTISSSAAKEKKSSKKASSKKKKSKGLC